MKYVKPTIHHNLIQIMRLENGELCIIIRHVRSLDKIMENAVQAISSRYSSIIKHKIWLNWLSGSGTNRLLPPIMRYRNWKYTKPIRSLSPSLGQTLMKYKKPRICSSPIVYLFSISEEHRGFMSGCYLDGGTMNMRVRTISNNLLLSLMNEIIIRSWVKSIREFMANSLVAVNVPAVRSL